MPTREVVRKAIELPVAIEPEADDLIVSYSELSTFRDCPLKHFIAYKNRWKKAPSEGSPLVKGTLWHNVMEAHYLAIQAWQQNHGGKPVALKDEATVLELARIAAEAWYLPEKGTEQSENQALIQWMYEGYVEKYGADRQWLILGIEYKLAEWLPDPEGNESEFLLKAKLDLIVMDFKTKGIWIIDHKSGANLPSQFDLEMDDQFGLYTWLLQQRGLKVMGSLHNAARTTRNQADFPDYSGKSKPQTLEQRMHRTYLNRGDAETRSIAGDAWAVAMNAYPPEGQELPLYSAPDPRTCGWKCDFKEAHLMARAGRPLQASLESFGFVQDFTRH